MRFRLEQAVVACGLATAGAAVAAVRLLKNPVSRVSRLVDRAGAPVVRVQVDGPALRDLVRAEAEQVFAQRTRDSRRQR
ncbi:hypothetical protein [Blastococcus sp. CCUG 61487]|uniref:hypothetical protein n=1 Tax=Blastococcus sp. CCUG 61487 TaxID=1840703 RepID=UPI0010C10846|nr:hypothetical protein [Blastococcus sp. CCUG 61487]TKJ25263.1 hypothetical protein A6V29_04375 [Blastococcus sp. CCUG 61487]